MPWRQILGVEVELHWLLTCALRGCEWSPVPSLRPLYHRENNSVPVEEKIEWAPEPVWVFSSRGQPLDSAGNRDWKQKKNITQFQDGRFYKDIDKKLRRGINYKL